MERVDRRRRVRAPLWTVCVWVLLAAGGAARGQEAAKPETRRAGDVAREVAALFARKAYAEAVDACRELIELAPQDASARYNLACALARLGKTDEALAALGEAVERGFVDADHIGHDRDLAGLRNDPRFRALLEKATAAEDEVFKRLPYERADEIPGLKTVEGNPPGGLRYRVRMRPDASKEHPQRLVVWMHPSGGSMNKAVEALAPRLAGQGWALMVFTQKRFQTWTDNDAARMMRSLRDAEGIQGLDTRKPVLFGFSAGGQMALALWYSRTAMFGGLVLDAAYPLVPGGENGAFRELPLPRNKAIRDVPILVLVGAKDNGRKVWERLQPAWEKGGVPLTLHVVPEMGHAWLMGRVQVALLETWLAGLGKPEAPREAPPPGQRGH